ncbi:MAG: hypothetical protein ACRDPC_05300 [Solirubrobacteraceae bacterium]
MTVDEDPSDEPPSAIEVEGQRYIYCGFAEDRPRYRHEEVAETV